SRLTCLTGRAGSRWREPTNGHWWAHKRPALSFTTLGTPSKGHSEWDSSHSFLFTEDWDHVERCRTAARRRLRQSRKERLPRGHLFRHRKSGAPCHSQVLRRRRRHWH